jgi:hypothetical protein
MEGTSGAAERDLLRGRSREATLSGCARGSGPTEAAARKRRSPGELEQDPRWWIRWRRRLQPATAASSRHEVSEPIGLGRSCHRERSRWEMPRLEAQCFEARPLARDLSAGSGSKGPVAIRSSATPQGDRRERSCTSGRLRVRYCGVRTAVVVLADRSDCRSRRAARGPSRPRAKSTWITTMGLATPRESAGSSERASEAGSSVAKRRDRWRAPKPNKPPAKAGFGEHTSMEGTRDRGSRSP